MPRIDMTELERKKLADAGRQSIACTHGWRPIETAPKDGTQVLVHDCGEIKVAFFREMYGHWSDGYEGINTPTHWQPLPKPPQGEM